MKNFSKLKNLQTLLIDDDEMIRNALTIAFQNKGCSLISCENAEKGLETLEKERFDIVICDLRLPGMDGLEFFRMAATHQPHMLKILISADGDTDFKSESFSIGVHAFLSKPFSVKELTNLLVHLLEEYLEKTVENCARRQARSTEKQRKRQL